MKTKGKNFSRNNGKRRKSDLYETPYSLTRLLLVNELLIGRILEPAAGNGAIVKVLREFKYKRVTAYDKEKDFFTEGRAFDTVITNPPYSMAGEFIAHAKRIATRKIAMLLPLTYLHGVERYKNIFSDRSFPLKHVYVFTRYPMLGEPLREDGKTNTGMVVYAWYVWMKSYSGEPSIRWLDNDPYIIRRVRI